MKRLLIIALLLIATPVLAQQPTELNLKVLTAEADLIWKGLRKLPVEEVEPLMAKLRQQVIDQTTPKPVEEVKPVEPVKKK